MILNTGNRTDIPAFYSEWLMNRIREGFVLSRNPYYPEQVYRYRIDPEVVDIIAFCTKNPAPMLPHLSELDSFRQFWFVTITPYGKEIEPAVPDKKDVMDAFRVLSDHVGPRCVHWRYDPIFLSDTYTIDSHIRSFEEICAYLSGYTHHIVISFIDLYEKTKKNFPEAREVSAEDRLVIGKAFSEIAAKYGMRINTCLEGTDMAQFGIDVSGCMTKRVLEEAIGEELIVPAGTSPAREGCHCLLGADIGAYNTCKHFCKYCYANYDHKTVLQNAAEHDPKSPFLIGHGRPGDEIREAKQVKYTTGQLLLF